MAKKAAPAKNTGGGGFTFADKVSAWFLSHCLSNNPPFGLDSGVIEKISYEVRPDGWYLDDLLIKTQKAGRDHNYSLSVKSNPQFGKKTAPSEFKGPAWEQFLQIGSTVFDHESDFLGMVTSPIETQTKIWLETILRKAKTINAETLLARYSDSDWAGAEEKELFLSFECPDPIKTKNEVEPGRIGELLKSSVFLQFDFESAVSESEKDSLLKCQNGLRSKNPEEAKKLWAELLRISSQLRSTGGEITKDELLNNLKGGFELAILPEYQPDWDKLNSFTRRQLKQIKSTVGSSQVIDRSEVLLNIRNSISSKESIILVGNSGCGKSNVLKQIAIENMDRGEEVFWISAEYFERKDINALEADLRLSYSIEDVLHNKTSPSAYLIIDGVDRVFNKDAFSRLSSFIRSICSKGGNWKLIFSAQTQDFSRVQLDLLQANVVDIPPQQVVCPLISKDKIKPIFESYNQLARIRLEDKLFTSFANLKILDLILTKVEIGETLENVSFIGETNIAEWFWNNEILRGENGVEHGEVVKSIAELQGDNLKVKTHVSNLDKSHLRTIGELKRKNILKQNDNDEVEFSHDLLGDWARLRSIIANSKDLNAYIKSRINSPLWARALRLFGLHILENKKDLKGWLEVSDKLGDLDEPLAADIFNESVMFSLNPLPLLEMLLPKMIEDNCKFFNRIVNRFLIFCTIPDPQILAIAKGKGWNLSSISASYRYPNFIYWGAFLGFIIKNKDSFLPSGAEAIARLSELWLKHTPKGFLLRKKIAEICYEIAKIAIDNRNEYMSDQSKRTLYYNVGLLSADEIPDLISDLFLLGVERVKSEEEQKAVVSRVPRSKVLTAHPLYNPNEKIPEPWEIGPFKRVEESLKKSLLGNGSLIPLIKTRPLKAKEIILASVVKPPRRYKFNDHWSEEMKLEIEDNYNWHPATFFHGPFLAFLNNNFEVGLELIADLISFTTARWEEKCLEREKRYKIENSKSQSEVDHILKMYESRRRPNIGLELVLSSGKKHFKGNNEVYGWSSGLANPPNTIEIALMALEKYFYLKIDKNEDIESEITLALEKFDSVTILRILVDVAKYKPSYLEGELKCIFSSPEVFDWDIQVVSQGRFHMMIGWFHHDQMIVDMTKEFHDMPHRNYDLREFAASCILQSPSLQSFIIERIEEWKARLASGEDPYRNMIEQVILSLDPRNYEYKEDSKYGTVLINEKILEYNKQNEDFMEQHSQWMAFNTLPYKCRRALNGEQKIENPEELWKLAIEVKAAIEEGKDKDGEEFEDVVRDNLVNGLVGVACVLLKEHRSWLDGNQTAYDWCRDNLFSVVQSPPERSQFDYPESAGNTAWDHFAAEVIPQLLKEEPSNSQVRGLAVNAVFFHHHEAMATFFKGLFEIRNDLEEDFRSLIWLLYTRALASKRVSFLNRFSGSLEGFDDNYVEEFLKNIDDWVNKRAMMFVNQKIKPSFQSWQDVDEPSLFQELDNHILKNWRWREGPDLEILIYGHFWIPQNASEFTPVEQETWIRFWEDMVSQVVKRPMKEIEDQVDRHSSSILPDKVERWIIERVAVFIQYIDPAMTSKLWKPIVSLRGEAHHWVEDFFKSFHSNGLKTKDLPNEFLSHYKQITDYLLQVPEESLPDWRYYNRVWNSIIGLDLVSFEYWKIDFNKEKIVTFGDIVLLWLEKAPFDSSRVGVIGNWAKNFVTVDFVDNFLYWFEDIFKTKFNLLEREDSVFEVIAEFLDLYWEANNQRILEDEKLLEGFKLLLSKLVSAQVTVALQLHGKIGGAI